MERRKHWWNGTWGRLARRDVYLLEDAGIWWVESREGGADGRCRRYQFTDEESAMNCVSGLLAQPGSWREIN